MTLIRLLLILVFVALFSACSDSQKASESNSVTVQKKLTPEEKFAKVLKDAEAGDAKAQFDLGLMYDPGNVGAFDDLIPTNNKFPKDASKALEWYQKSAAQGHAEAQIYMGLAYLNGVGVSRDVAKAVAWFEKAAAQGNADAQYHLGLLWYDPGHFSELSNPFDRFYLEDIAAIRDATKAFESFQKAATQGHTQAQIKLGLMYEQGEGAPKDAFKALEWYQKAAALGNIDAQKHLGWIYSRGNGVPKDLTKAFEWYQKAAEQGDAGAQFNLGSMYDQGDGVPKDAAKAVEWFQKAAAQGDADAQYNLGAMYANGEGVARNWVLAYAWCNLASAANSENRAVRDKIERRLSPAQRAEGQRLASNWKKGDILQAAGDTSPNASAPGGAPTKQGLGTGFVVSSLGYALTNHHVIDGCKEIRVTGQDGVIKVVTFDTVNDLALLQMPGRANFATLTDNPAKLRQGEDIVVYGYPLNYLLSSGGNLTPGTVSALSGLGNNTNQIQITAPIQPGSSGSPVMDKKGNIVGVVSMKLSDSKMARATGSVGQNVNFAVNGQTVKSFLDANKVSYKTGGGFFSREINNADIAEEARKWTVVLECWK